MAQKLTTDVILNKEFHIDFKGYSAVEVDQFLDDVMQDYETFQSIIREQQELIARYEETLNQQKRMLIEQEGKVRAQEDQLPGQFSHVDILKRISRLEETVYRGNEK